MLGSNISAFFLSVTVVCTAGASVPLFFHRDMVEYDVCVRRADGVGVQKDDLTQDDVTSSHH
eukprot:3126226-Rhodomonas_salina.1